MGVRRSWSVARENDGQGETPGDAGAVGESDGDRGPHVTRAGAAQVGGGLGQRDAAREAGEAGDGRLGRVMGGGEVAVAPGGAVAVGDDALELLGGEPAGDGEAGGCDAGQVGLADGPHDRGEGHCQDDEDRDGLDEGEAGAGGARGPGGYGIVHVTSPPSARTWTRLPPLSVTVPVALSAACVLLS